VDSKAARAVAGGLSAPGGGSNKNLEGPWYEGALS